MSAGTLLRLAFAGGRQDAARMTLTAVAGVVCTAILLAVGTVFAVVVNRSDWVDGPNGSPIPNPDPGPYTIDFFSNPSYRFWISVAMLVLCVPVITFAAQCVRLGAPARDRRLAAIRLAGATPWQTRLIVLVETGLAALAGSLFGTLIFEVVRLLADHPGRRAFPTDVSPSPLWFVLVVLGLPIAVMLIAALLLRRVVVSPLGVARRHRSRPPRPWPGIVIGLGVACTLVGWSLNVAAATANSAPSALVLPLMAGGFALTSTGLALGNAWLSSTIGRLCYRFANKPSLLLAARRLTADPWFGSRTYAVVLISLSFGALVAFVHGFLASLPNEDTRGVGLINAGMVILMSISAAGLVVVLVESVVSQRRTLAALVAAGTPRSVLVKAIMWQVMLSFVPCAVLALAIGALLGNQMWGHLGAKVPWADLLLLGGSASGIVLIASALATLALRDSTRVSELRFE
jgi:hypothetical protein